MAGLIGLLLFLGAAIVPLVLARRPRTEEQRRTAGDRFARQFRTYIAPEATGAVDAMLERHGRSGYRQIAAMCGFFGISVLLMDRLGWTMDALFICGALPFVLLSALGGSMTPRTARDAQAPQVRHTTSDFIPPLLRVLNVGVGLAGLLTAGWIWVAPSERVVSTTVPMALLPALGTLAAEIGAYVIARAPHELPEQLHYVEDAARSTRVGGAYTSFGILGGLALSFALMGQDASELTLAIFPLMLLLVAASYWPHRQDLWFRRRLWPQLEREEIQVVPGTPVTA